MAIWDDIITESDKEIYRKSGYGEREISLGNSPALVIIDVVYDFVGNEPEPILKSIERFPNSCGENGWKAIYQIASLLPLARNKQVPIIYSIPIGRLARVATAKGVAENKMGNEVVREIAPAANDIIIHKLAPSVFLGTSLLSTLVPLKIDTLLICGGTTSGCVRASVVDASSYGFTVGVIEECTFDRGEVTHKVNLFDMNAKYAVVMSTARVKDYLHKLPKKGHA